MERRKSVRYDGLSDLTGKLYNVINFHVKNISREGINIVSHFQPIIGSSYMIYINNDGQIQDFHIRALRVEVYSFDSGTDVTHPGGMKYSIGAVFEQVDETRKKFIRTLMATKCNDIEAGFLQEKKSKGSS